MVLVYELCTTLQEIFDLSTNYYL